MKAILRNARISPKKANLVAGMVRGRKAQEALNQLKFTPKKAAHILSKVIHSAMSNAVTNRAQDAEKLMIKQILINKGVTFKRGIPVSRGRYHPILKRNSNITVEVGLPEPIKETPSVKKKEEVIKKPPKIDAEKKKNPQPKNPTSNI